MLKLNLLYIILNMKIKEYAGGSSFPNPNQSLFAKRLALSLKKAGISQNELSEKTGISKGAISSYLAERYAPKALGLFKIAHVLNVDPYWLNGTLPIDGGTRIQRLHSDTQAIYIPLPHPNTDDFSLTPEEIELIHAYREHPEYQEAVNRILGIQARR